MIEREIKSDDPKVTELYLKMANAVEGEETGEVFFAVGAFVALIIDEHLEQGNGGSIPARWEEMFELHRKVVFTELQAKITERKSMT